MKQKNRLGIVSIILAAGAIALAIQGCGGGGGGSAPAPAQAQATGKGKVGAVVKLTGRTAGREAAGVSTATVTVNLSVSGYYSVTGAAFAPVTTSTTFSLSQASAKISMLDVPIGVNHLLTAVADWGGATETVKVIIPEVIDSEVVQVTADQVSTVVADTAIYYTEQNKKTLPELDKDFLAQAEAAVASLASLGTSYAQMKPADVLAYMAIMNVPYVVTILPAQANVVAGQTLQFQGNVENSNHGSIPGAVVTWSFSDAAIGSVNSTGLFTATGLGTGVLTASIDNLTATAPVTVIAACLNDGNCDDGNNLTLDVCTNKGAANAACAHTPIACTTSADCAGGAPVCVNGGAASAACVVCAADLDCNDNNPQTVDSCANPGTANAVCKYTTYVPSANITADTNWSITGSPYIIQGQLNVDPGVTLTIDPGVELQFLYPPTGTDFFAGPQNLGGIRVEGTLHAVGTSASPITMRLDPAAPADAIGYWGGVYFTNNGTGQMEYVNMDGPAYAIQVTDPNDTGMPGLTISHINVTNAGGPQLTGGVNLPRKMRHSFHVYTADGAGWQQQAVEHYGLKFEERAINLNNVRADANGLIKLRISQEGMEAANVDSAILYLDGAAYPPVSATDLSTGLNLAAKLSRKDNDVIGAHDKTIELAYSVPGGASFSRATLSLTAREEDGSVLRGGVPFRFPSNQFFDDMKTAKFYTYAMGANGAGLRMDGMETPADALPSPAFTELTVPQTGHPDGYAYGYMKNDGRYLYAALDFTSDNTYDGDADYAAIYVRVGDSLKKFRVSVPETTYGSAGFTYTDKVSYQHKYYEFKIPLSEIGNPAPGSSIQYMFEAYGTAATFGSVINVTGVGGSSMAVTMSDISISFSPTDTGMLSGIILMNVGSVNLSNISVDGSPGYALMLYTVNGGTVNGVNMTNTKGPVGVGIVNGEANGLTVTNVNVTNGFSGTSGIAVNSTSGNISITNCKLDLGAVGYAAQISSTTGTVSMTNCDMSYTGYGLIVDSASVDVSNSTISNNCAYAVNTNSVATGTLNITDTNITGNYKGIYGFTGGPLINLNGVYLENNNSAGVGVVDMSTALPTSDSPVWQYEGVNSIVNPRSTPAPGTPSNAGTTPTCGG